MTVVALEEAIAKLVELVKLPDQGEEYYQAWLKPIRSSYSYLAMKGSFLTPSFGW